MKTTDFLDIANAICPKRDAIVFEGKRWTFAELADRVDRLGRSLVKLDVKKGDRIGVLHVNCNQYVEIYFASAKVGAILVPLNFRAKVDELAYMMGNAEVKLLFVGERYLEMVETLLPQQSYIKNCILIDKRQRGRFFYKDLVGESPLKESAPDIGDDDITLLMYTAGTTGRPKGVPLRHSVFVSYMLGNVEPANPETEERNLLTVPMYHIAGIQTVMASVYGGRTLVLMRQFEVQEWMKTVQEERATRALLVPTMLKWVVEDPEFHRYDLSSLKVVTYGAAPMPYEVIKKALDKMPWVQFINAFGQTETASTITTLGPEDHVIEGTEEEKKKKLRRLRFSIGKPLSDVEVKIVDERGRRLGAGEVGEILAKGPRVMTGYWRDQEKSTEVLSSNGWLRTGDVGWMDEEGYVFLSGRDDDMIIRGGENISPEEVENVLNSHPKIEEAAVIGVSDPEWGQQPRAVVVLKEGEAAEEEEIIEFCRSKLAGFKRPRSVVFVDSLPRNPMGKILKKKLRERYGQG